MLFIEPRQGTKLVKDVSTLGQAQNCITFFESFGTNDTVAVGSGLNVNVDKNARSVTRLQQLPEPDGSVLGQENGRNV